ncbi:uncharacterized protein LOC106086740 [Stomoxys calcitrans]|uniref:uncharacterized protein LOC106086740 n=1 Tax=Stomoxys calcitrans TaxID=35570 RepID=UPI0027E2F3F0|nr:uncharacterized protein LOC106086740 [Stomoxys calcitrans]
MSNFVYLDVELKLRDDTSAVLTSAYFQGSIESSLLDFFGEIGGQTELELIEFDVAKKRGILKVPKEYTPQTRAAITLIGRFQEIPCHFAVLKASEKPIEL